MAFVRWSAGCCGYGDYRLLSLETGNAFTAAKSVEFEADCEKDGRVLRIDSEGKAVGKS